VLAPDQQFNPCADVRCLWPPAAAHPRVKKAVHERRQTTLFAAKQPPGRSATAASRPPERDTRGHETGALCKPAPPRMRVSPQPSRRTCSSPSARLSAPSTRRCSPPSHRGTCFRSATRTRDLLRWHRPAALLRFSERSLGEIRPGRQRHLLKGAGPSGPHDLSTPSPREHDSAAILHSSHHEHKSAAGQRRDCRAPARAGAGTCLR
jgi:hypothetical protein